MNVKQLGYEKIGASLNGLATLLTTSFEVEAWTKKQSYQIEDSLRTLNGGHSTSPYMGDNNGWNRDTHEDGSIQYYDSVGRTKGLYPSETSTSAINFLNFLELKNRLNEVLETYENASGGVYHTHSSSTHVHNTLTYYGSDTTVQVDTERVYPNVAMFLIKYMPVMKWLTMTCIGGSRGSVGNPYDKLNNDSLFDWFELYHERGFVNDRSKSYLVNMGRDSYMRVQSSRNLHWENRMCDQTYSNSHLAMWLSINKAITLLSLDFARNNLLFNCTVEDFKKSRQLMRKYKDENGYKDIRNEIKTMYKQFIGHIAKYLKILGCMEAIELADKLIEKPISEFVESFGTHYEAKKIEGVFNKRNRATNVELRTSFIETLQAMTVNASESLNEHLEDVAQHLDVETSKVKSLYQMLKRENIIDIEFIGGRLVLM